VKIFIDCGANKGSDIDMFKINHKDHQSWRMIAFEPNPKCVDYMLLNGKLDNVELIEKAVWIEDSTMTFNIGSNTKSSTLRSDKKTHMSNKKMTVKTVDLTQKIKNSKEDNLQLRQDKITEQLIEKLGSDNVYIHEGHNAKKFKTLVKT
jgi:FkbM family methyltransferase